VNEARKDLINRRIHVSRLSLPRFQTRSSTIKSTERKYYRFLRNHLILFIIFNHSLVVKSSYDYNQQLISLSRLLQSLQFQLFAGICVFYVFYSNTEVNYILLPSITPSIYLSFDHLVFISAPQKSNLHVSTMRRWYQTSRHKNRSFIAPRQKARA